MPTLGEELKRMREERGIALADIAEGTRIGTRFLKAIEENNFSVLPGGIFTRSFIRAYAKRVGMDEDEAIGLYQQHLAEESGELPPPREEHPAAAAVAEPTDQAPNHLYVTNSSVSYTAGHPRSRWPTVVIVIAIVFLVGIIVVAVSKRLNRMDDDVGRATSPQQTSPRPSPPQGAAATATKSPNQPAQETPKPPEPSPTVPRTDIAQLPLGQGISVRIEATTGDSWVKYQVDQEKAGIVLLKPGEGKDLPAAREQVKLNLGNRKTIKLKINNKEATFPSTTPNFAAQVIISRENLQTYFQ